MKESRRLELSMQAELENNIRKLIQTINNLLKKTLRLGFDLHAHKTAEYQYFPFFLQTGSSLKPFCVNSGHIKWLYL